MRPVQFGEALAAGTRLTLFSDDKPDRLFTVIKFWLDETSGVALALKTGVPSYQVEDEEGGIHLLLHLPSRNKMKFDGASGGPIRPALILVSCPTNNMVFAAARRVAMKMGRRLLCSSVTYPFRYAPLLAPCRRPILIATNAMLVTGPDTGSIFEGALVDG
jgi:hypothetical protein